MNGNRRPAARVARPSDPRERDPRERLLHATLQCALQEGGSALSLQAIAREAAVSKALILYHFGDKDELLSAFVAWLTDRATAREGRALARSSASTVLEELWEWLDAELTAGELRVLIELTGERGSGTRQALEQSVRRRHDAADATVARVFQVLELSPRLPSSMLASCELAFREGLVLFAARQPDRNSRVAFDVFWLSLLSLAR